MRIYEVNEAYQVDLAKIVAIKQCFDTVKEHSGIEYRCWIEITIDSGAKLVINCADFDVMRDTYNMIGTVWKYYVGDYGDQSILYQTVDQTDDQPEEEEYL